MSEKIRDLKARKQHIGAEIKKANLWFISHAGSKQSWDERINAYRALVAEYRQLTEQITRMNAAPTYIQSTHPTNMKKSTIPADVAELTTEQLQTLLKQRQDAEKRKAERERKRYEEARDMNVARAIETAEKLSAQLTAFKGFVHGMMNEQAEMLASYGKIRSNSKGGFTVTHGNEKWRITRRRDTEPQWDERSTKAIELIRDFLGDTIKKRDKDLYEILISFLQRNEKGDLEYSRVMSLFQHAHKFDDPRWVEGLNLIRESYSNHLRGFGYEFKVKREDGKWHSLPLNFSSI